MNITEKALSDRYIGRCIYCGSTNDLSDEHIVPFGLNGPWKLSKASCPQCRDITSLFEMHVLRQQFIEPRSVLNFPTRHRSNRPTDLSFLVQIDGVESSITLPVNECPPMFVMLDLEKPRKIDNYTYHRGVLVKGCSLHSSKDALKRFENLGTESFNINVEIRATSFEKMLAKIAYGMTVLAYGYDCLSENYILSCILGEADDVGYWVGSSGIPISQLPRDKYLHKIGLSIDKNTNEVRVLIRLFANYHTPEYLVIVGALNKDH
jgi:hypothetical protein